MLCLLGPPRWADGDRAVDLYLQPKALAMLAYLALAGRPVDRRALAALLFPEAADPRATLRWHLAHVRANAPPGLRAGVRASRESIAIEVATDVALFRERARRLIVDSDATDAAATLALYRGDLLTGLAVAAGAEFDAWLYVEQEAARRQFRQAAVAAARSASATGASLDPTEALARLVAVDPYCEEAHRLLIAAHEARGRPAAAAAAYARYQRVVREELAAEPEPSLARRYEGEARPGPRLPGDGLVVLPDVTLHVVDWPGGEPPVVAIHGSNLSAYTLTALAGRLAPAVRVVALDLRGHGFSDKPASGYTVERHAADVRALVGALGLRRPVVLGFSMGGAIATAVASAGDVGGLVLLDGVVGIRAFVENAAAELLGLGAAYTRRHGGFHEYAAQMRKFQREGDDEGERVAERIARFELAPMPDGTYRKRGIQRALEETWLSLAEADGLAALARVRCPVLVVQAALPWPGETPYLPDAAIDDQLRAAPHAERFVARRSTHPVLVRNPEDEMVDAVADFVRRCAAAAVPIPRAAGAAESTADRRVATIRSEPSPGRLRAESRLQH